MNEPHDGIGPMTEGGERGEGEHGAALVERLAKVACDTYWKGVGEWCSVGGHKDWCIAIRAILREVGLVWRKDPPDKDGDWRRQVWCEEDGKQFLLSDDYIRVTKEDLTRGFYVNSGLSARWAGPIPEPVEESDEQG